MTKEEAAKIIEAYEELVDRALDVVESGPFYAYVDHEDVVGISLDGDNVVLRWKTYESDYYGGGSLSEESTKFPIDALILSKEELAALKDKFAKAEAERQAKVTAAREAVARDRKEAFDRAEYARLTAKFGTLSSPQGTKS